MIKDDKHRFCFALGVVAKAKTGKIAHRSNLNTLHLQLRTISYLQLRTIVGFAQKRLEVRTPRNDAIPVQVGMGGEVVVLDLLHVDRLLDARHYTPRGSS